ncbi:hypothetical protein [Rhodopila globiformis]|uniref:Uncharacterized protein n=1 Tax=Rhodopila globiformis TaxID=1071 RepID=A0A2S6N0J6_RHOGL|nr:hypothetical protein [Rhodopila globiformis]PPQ28119.1 hypothetical protein CCS01_25080 [Rhodopila globiformis]
MSAGGGGTRLGRLAGGLVVLLLGLIGGGLIALAPDIAVPAGILLAPGLVAFMLDPTPGHALARAMLLFQAAAALRPLDQAWFRCEGLHACMGTLAQPRQVLLVWIMAALAWLLTQILPIGLKLLSDYRVRVRRATLEARRDRLIAEWGLDETPRRS